MRKQRLLALLLAPLLLVAVSCGGKSLDDKGSSGGSGDKGAVVVGGRDFTESQILAEIYKALLEKDGFKVTTKLVNRCHIGVAAIRSTVATLIEEHHPQLIAEMLGQFSALKYECAHLQAIAVHEHDCQGRVGWPDLWS